MQEENYHKTPEDISNSAQGHKANLSNPNTSEASKYHSQSVLRQLGDEQAFYGKEEEAKNPNNVAGGLKAAINNPNLSSETKEAAKEKLEEMK